MVARPRPPRPALAACFFLGMAVATSAGAVHDAGGDFAKPVWLALPAAAGAVACALLLRREPRRARVAGPAARTHSWVGLASGAALALDALPRSVSAGLAAAVAGACAVATGSFALQARGRQGSRRR